MGNIIFILLSTLLFILGVNGAAKFEFNFRIMGGEPTTIEEFPHQVSIMYIDMHFCGGSLINPRFVLTAAHCTMDIEAKNFMVRAGTSFLDQGGEVRQVSVKYEHKDFNIDTMDYDISILELEKHFDLSNKINIISLPVQDEKLLDGTTATITGWGRLYTDGPLPMELQKVSLPLISTINCKKYLGSTITDRMICAGLLDGKKDSCQGDSGGPLVTNGLLLGIISWGDGCGNPNSPGVYTQVSYFRNYIDNIVNNS